MGIFSARPPSIPPIDDAQGVAAWFFTHDEKIKDFRANFPELVERAIWEVTEDLGEHIDGASLKAHTEKIGDFWSQTALPAAAALQERGAPFSDDEIETRYVEALLAAKFRILGYFLHKKYDLTPIGFPSASRTMRLEGIDICLDIHVTKATGVRRPDGYAFVFADRSSHEDRVSRELLLFCSYVLRQMVNTGDLGTITCAKTFVGEHGMPSLLKMASRSSPEITDYEGNPSPQRFLFSLFSRGSELGSKLKIKGYPFFRKSDVDQQALTSCLLLPEFLENREGVGPEFKLALEKAKALCGAAVIGSQVTLTNQLDIARSIVESITLEN